MTYFSPGSHLNGLTVSESAWAEPKQVDAAAAIASVLKNLRKFPPLAKAILNDYRVRSRRAAMWID
ncbi:hypothetical protein [Mesorhizobium australafricanum]|uniref:hypothetical protein n=1 Tax=Mesorhizobium australafricanum TaxID=3072311 RepID=UPI002A242A4E|nr:hypothetical protein [Mesorhizobium sp. VK9D]